MVEALIKIFVGFRDYRGRTPLNVAAKEGCSKVVEKLLAYNAYPSLYLVNELSSLYQAIVKKYHDAVKLQY